MAFRIKDLLINVAPADSQDASMRCLPESHSGLCKATYMAEDVEDNGSGRFKAHVYCTITCERSVPPTDCGAHKCSPIQELKSHEDVSNLRKLLREALEELELRESEL